MGASPGGFGTVLAQNGWLPVLHTLGHAGTGAAAGSSSPAQAVRSATGDLVDDGVRERLREFLTKFVEFAAPR
jgi:NAD(P)H-dependent FMN reductase